ncbi:MULTISPECIES: hypothetical protein [Streptomyces]|uniref:Uncharacterized protein n=2 Tax=Streptomyces TaxID=1883 RepID=A0A1D8FY92_9ACTN|nr:MULTISPECIES: hypothetical protein [Streptomyces]AOT58135.1 hypothetical protein A4G23_00939 [Streptomyces rubrolavendulae]KAF0646180.1 hypothetical protein K701_30065 [Streptomyces fradiae ATCC 10745 = DSM 40063]OSY53331.1 hypothetical protein BG846_01002 [Streptomyces fradiae ATCC 10745 = DSM 40063]UQS28840.1 hypothetical protein J5J01_17600 [Streptomyces fradiae]WOI60087.1 hypothetical protein RYQ63_09350 [Streptomyces fradiae]
MAINATTPINEQADEKVAQGFAPHVAAHDVDEVTLGRQDFNDSDKTNYFEG